MEAFVIAISSCFIYFTFFFKQSEMNLANEKEVIMIALVIVIYLKATSH